MNDIWIVFSIIGALVALFAWDRIPIIAVCMGAALALWATGILTLQQSLSGFGDPAVIFIASLFVVSAGLEVTGVTTWAGQILMRQAGTSRTRLIVLMMGLVAVLSALISVNGAVAALIPVVVVMSIRLKRPASQLLMPLVFGAHAGSKLLLTGSPVNILVVEGAEDAGGRGFTYFEFALVGVPLVLGCIAIVVLFGERLLPSRSSKTLPPDLSRHALTLAREYRLAADVHQLLVRPGSPLIGMTRDALPLPRPLALVTLLDSGGKPSGAREVAAGQYLVLRGPADQAAEAAGRLGLTLRDAGPTDLPGQLLNAETGLAEVLIPPRSPLIGQDCFPGMVTAEGDLVVLAVQRSGSDLEPGTPLAPGDSLLLQGSWLALESRLHTDAVLVVDRPEVVRGQAVPMGPGAPIVLVALGVMVLILGTGIAPPAVGGLLAAGIILVSGVLNTEQVYRSIKWTTVILIAALTPLSTAMQVTGAADMLAHGLVDLVGDAGPRALLAGIFLLSAGFSQVISNTATSMVVIPIAAVAAAQMGISVQPVLMCVSVACAGAFLTPVATPTNLMVMEPGAYRFGDYWKLGLPMLVWFFLVTLFYVPLIWSF